MDRSIMPMLALVKTWARRVEGLELIAEWEHVFRSPARCAPAIEVNTLSSRVHHEVNRRASAKQAAHGDNCFTASKML